VVQPGSALEAGKPLIRVNNFQDTRIDLSDVMYISPEIEAKYSRTRLKGGEVLLTIVGSVGQVAVVPPRCAGFNVARAVAVIHPLPNIAPEWIALCLRSPLSQHLLESRANTTVQTTINLKDLRALPIPLPPDAERRTIAEFVGALDDRITLLRETNVTLEAIAQALFKSWFVNFDPVRAKMEGRAPEGMDEAVASLFPDGFEESELGLVPRGWKTAVLAELTTKIGSGATPRGGKDVYLDDGVALIRSQNIYDSEFVWGGLARISNDAADQLKSVEVKPTDVLLNITGASILRTCAVIPDVLPARVNQHVAIIRAKENIPSRYIHLHLLQRKTKEFLLGLNAGGSREAVTKAHIESVPIILPSDAVLAVFKEITNPIYRRNEEFSRQERTLVNLRDTLLPCLISGQLRLPEVQQKLEDVAA
jgi:type I restriction enzyme S subunit